MSNVTASIMLMSFSVSHLATPSCGGCDRGCRGVTRVFPEPYQQITAIPAHSIDRHAGPTRSGFVAAAPLLAVQRIEVVAERAARMIRRRAEPSKGHGAISRPHAILVFERPDVAPRRIFHEPSALRCGHRGTFTHGTNGGRCARACVGRHATCNPPPLMVATGQRPLCRRDETSMWLPEAPGDKFF